jgi:Flp pilus assembly protein TadG
VFRILLRECAGMAAIELALVSLLYFPLIFGIIEFGRYAADRQDLMHAVYLTSRYAVVHGSSSTSPATTATLRTMVGSKLLLLPASGVQASASFSPDNKPNSRVTITATYTWTPLVPMLNLPSTTISATSTATILN